MDIKIKRSAREVMLDKLSKGEDIKEKDVWNLKLFNDEYIALLFSFGQQTVRGKMLEVMTRESVVVF